MTAILIDDEKGCLESLEIDLQTYCPDVKVLAKCQSAEKALEVLAAITPDMIFLDISMPQMNAFDFLLKVPKINFEIIFCTAYDAFALTAFDFCAIDYLLKPVAKDKLIPIALRCLLMLHGSGDARSLIDHLVRIPLQILATYS